MKAGGPVPGPRISSLEQRERRDFPFWGAIALPAGLLWGIVLGIGIGYASGNVFIGGAIGAAIGIGIGLSLLAAAVVIASHNI